MGRGPLLKTHLPSSPSGTAAILPPNSVACTGAWQLLRRPQQGKGTVLSAKTRQWQCSTTAKVVRCAKIATNSALGRDSSLSLLLWQRKRKAVPQGNVQSSLAKTRRWQRKRERQWLTCSAAARPSLRSLQRGKQVSGGIGAAVRAPMRGSERTVEGQRTGSETATCVYLLPDKSRARLQLDRDLKKEVMRR